MHTHNPRHDSSLRNLRITAIDRPGLRAVLVADDNGLTMRWITSPRTSGRHLPADDESSRVDGTYRYDAA